MTAATLREVALDAPAVAPAKPAPSRAAVLPPHRHRGGRRRSPWPPAGALYIASPKATVTTDAAYVQADSAVVAPKVRGLVAQVLVAHDQAVSRGDPLVRIDPEEFDARVASAAADLQTPRPRSRPPRPPWSPWTPRRSWPPPTSAPP